MTVTVEASGDLFNALGAEGAGDEDVVVSDEDEVDVDVEVDRDVAALVIGGR